MKRKLLALALLVCLAPTAAWAQPASQQKVFFNTETRKYHSFACKWAKKCTVHCVPISKDKAQRQGVPCKVCKGG